jgi:hypothetical protein
MIGAAEGRIDRHGSADAPLVVAAERLGGPVPDAHAPWLPESASPPTKLSACRPVWCHEGRRQPGPSFPMFHKALPARPLVASTSFGTESVHQM